MNGLNIVVYDLESRELIPPPSEGQPAYRTLSEEEYKFMGISCGALYDYRSGDYSVYMGDNMGVLTERLNSADLVVAFNNIGFDNQLLRACGHPLKPDSELNQYDMLYYSRRATGWKDGERYPSGLKLDNHLEATFGKQFMKTGAGAEAPGMWKEGKLGELLSYCLADVRREKMLFEQIWNFGWVATPKHGKKWIEWPHKNFKRYASNLG